jgi:hypothetical protein
MDVGREARTARAAGPHTMRIIQPRGANRGPENRRLIWMWVAKRADFRNSWRSSSVFSPTRGFRGPRDRVFGRPPTVRQNSSNSSESRLICPFSLTKEPAFWGGFPGIPS